MSNVTPVKAPVRAGRLTPDEAQTLVRQAKAVVHGVRVCIDYDEEVSAYALEVAQEMLDRVDDALGLMAPKPSSSDEMPS